MAEFSLPKNSKIQKELDELSKLPMNELRPKYQRYQELLQTILDFGRGLELKKSITGLDLAKAKLLKKEQDILYKTTEAYTGLVLANEKLKINLNNVELLSRQVETDRIRVDVPGIYWIKLHHLHHPHQHIPLLGAFVEDIKIQFLSIFDDLASRLAFRSIIKERFHFDVFNEI